MAVVQGNSRVGNASRVAVGTENTNYTLPDNSVEYVYAASVEFTGGDRNDPGDSVTLQFRTGADAFATLSNASGAVRTGTVLTDQDTVTSGERLTTGGIVYNPGTEIEGTNSVGTMLSRTQAAVTECQWSLDFSNAATGTTYDFQVVWVHKNGTDTFQYLSITTAAPAGPVLTLPTEANIGQTTVTVGCTTDTAAGTLYYYISTSATPPTAANLKAGTGAVKFGNVTTPGVGTETFNVTGLNNNTTYYTYFIQNDGANDSNILESGSWSTLPPATDSHTFTVNKVVSITKTMDATASHTMALNSTLDFSGVKTTSEAVTFLTNLIENRNVGLSISDAINFIINVASQESNQRILPLSLNLDSTFNFLVQNLLSSPKSITIGTLLDTVFVNNKSVQESVLFSLNLFDSRTISLEGSAAFGLSMAYLADSQKVISEQFSASVILTEAEQISKLLSENQSFSFTLTFDQSPFGVGVLDDPIFSAGNYIFVDLANIVVQDGAVKTGSVTFTNSLGQQQTVGLIGQAAHTFLTTLIETHTGVRTTTETATFSILNDLALSITQLVEFTASINLDMLPTNQSDALRSLLYSISLDQNQTNVKETPGVLSLTSSLDMTALNNLLANTSINLDINLDYLTTVGKDIADAVTFLTNLDLTNIAADLSSSIAFAMTLSQNQQVTGTLVSALTLASNLASNFDKQLVIAKAITFLTNLNYQIDGVIGLINAVEFGLSLSQTQSNVITADKAISYLINLTQEQNYALTTPETILLTVLLLDTYSNTKTVPTSTFFDITVQQTQANLLTKVTAAVFSAALSMAQVGQADFNALINFAQTLSTLFIGDTQGTLTGLMTFAVNMSQQHTSLGAYLGNVQFNSILELLQIGGLVLTDQLTITAQLGQDQSYNLTREGLVTFQSFYNKQIGVEAIMRPSLDFNLQLLDTSASNKNTLASMLLDLEAGLIANASRTVPGLVDFALTQNYETDIHLIADGRVTLSSQLAESAALQMLGQKGITFGHLLGLSAFANANLGSAISFGTVQGLSVQGFVLQFTIVTPDHRKLKIYIEDRTLIVSEEGREIIIYRDFRQDKESINVGIVTPLTGSFNSGFSLGFETNITGGGGPVVGSFSDGFDNGFNI